MEEARVSRSLWRAFFLALLGEHWTIMSAPAFFQARDTPRLQCRWFRIPSPMLERLLPLERALVVFDTETTGTNARSDRIVEIACVKVHPDGRRETWIKRINPGMPIPAGST